MTDNELMQDFFDTFTVTNKLNAIVLVDEFLAGRHGLSAYGPQADADPKHVLSCIKRIHKGIGPRLFKSFVALEDVAPSEGLDDVWASWCPLPEGIKLHQQRYPVGAIPLWSNGTQTVFCKIEQDAHGNEEVIFGIY